VTRIGWANRGLRKRCKPARCRSAHDEHNAWQRALLVRASAASRQLRKRGSVVGYDRCSSTWLLKYLFTEVLDGRNAYVADGVQRALGREPREFSEFVRDAAATGVWNPSAVTA
jgi:hypothetical protein